MTGRRDWKNKVVGYEVVDPLTITANPKNYRRHTGVQREALRDSLDSLNIITPVIVNKTTGHLVDGHARVEEYLNGGVREIPVAYVELTEEEEALALLFLDPIAAMADEDAEALNALLDEVRTDSEGIQRMLSGLAEDAQNSTYSVERSFKPKLDPEIELRDVTDDQIERVKEMLSTGYKQTRNLAEVVCPNCGQSFFIDKAYIPRDQAKKDHEPRPRIIKRDWENKVIGYDVVDPEQLLANPKNYRRHGADQREALRGSLDELNIIAPIIVNSVTGNVIDGHARCEEYIAAGITEVPVAYIELDEDKEALALLSLDPIAAMAETDVEKLDDLLAGTYTRNEGLQWMLGQLAEKNELMQYSAQSFGTLPEEREVTMGDVIEREEEDDIPGLIHVMCPHCGEVFYVDRELSYVPQAGGAE